MSQLMQFYRSFQQARTPVAKPAPTFEDLTIDDRLTEHQRVVRYTKSPIGLQRLVHVKMLADVAQNVGYEATASSLIPLLMPLSNDLEPVIKQHVVQQLKSLAEFCISSGGEDGYKTVINHILPIAARLLEDDKVEVRHSASMTLVKIAPLLTQDDIGQYVLTIVLRLAHEDDKEDMRMTASQLLNLLAETLGHDYCKQFVIPEVVSLAEDPVFRVRKATALNFNNICKVGGEHELLERLMPAFVRLSKDDMYRVRRACAESVTDISKNVSDDVRLGVLVEIFLRLTQDPSKNVKHSILQQSGMFIATLPSPYVSGTILQHYCSMIYYPTGDISMDSELRQICAFCFPAVLQTIGKERWSEVREVYKNLTQSTSAGIRQTLAHSLHEVALILDDPSLVEDELVAVFEEMIQAVEPVQMGVINHMAIFLGTLPELCRVSFLPLLQDILRSTNPFNWRLRQSLAVQLPELAKLPKKEDMYRTLFPLILTLLQDPVASVRVASFPGVTALMTTLYELSTVTTSGAQLVDGEGDTLYDDNSMVAVSRHYLDSLANSINSFALGEKHQLRQLWVELCHRLLWDLPRHIFESYFIEGILLLTRDRVTNVRITVSSFLAGWKIGGGAIHARTPVPVDVTSPKADQSPQDASSPTPSSTPTHSTAVHEGTDTSVGNSTAGSGSQVNLAAIPSLEDTPYSWLLARPDVQECVSRLAEDDLDVYLNMRQLQAAFPHVHFKPISCRGMSTAPGGSAGIEINPPLERLWKDGPAVQPQSELGFLTSSSSVSMADAAELGPAYSLTGNRPRGYSGGASAHEGLDGTPSGSGAGTGTGTTRKPRSSSGDASASGGFSLYTLHPTSVSAPVFSAAESSEGEDLAPTVSNLEDEFLVSNSDNLHIPPVPHHYSPAVPGGYAQRPHRTNVVEELSVGSEMSNMAIEMDKIDGIFTTAPIAKMPIAATTDASASPPILSPHPHPPPEHLPPLPPSVLEQDLPPGTCIAPVDISGADVLVAAPTAESGTEETSAGASLSSHQQGEDKDGEGDGSQSVIANANANANGAATAERAPTIDSNSTSRNKVVLAAQEVANNTEAITQFVDQLDIS